MKCHPTFLGMLLICGGASLAWGDSSSAHFQRKHRHHVRRPIVSKASIASVETATPAKSDAEEEEHYEAVKAEAKADPHIRELKEKSDSALDDQAGRDAAIAYYRALFQRIRETDKSLTERANLAEEAVLRRFAQP